jgi:polyphosphate kinase
VKTEAFVNRELSWLEFNRRVLEEAEDPTVPLLERVKFLAIVSSNLDEFFMVRVAGLKRRIREGDGTAGPDGLSPGQTRAAVAERARRLSDEQHQCFLDQLEPLLAAEGICLIDPTEITPDQEKFLDAYFQRTLLPVVTPLAIDLGHPFPHLGNRSLCLIASLTPATASPLPHAVLAVVHIPTPVVPRFVQLPAPAGEHAFILLENVIRLYLSRIYHG